MYMAFSFSSSEVRCYISFLSSAIRLVTILQNLRLLYLFLFCRCALRHLRTERVRKFDYCMPCKLNWVLFISLYCFSGITDCYFRILEIPFILRLRPKCCKYPWQCFSQDLVNDTTLMFA